MAGAPPPPAAAPLTDAGRVTPPSKRAPKGPLPPEKRRKHQPVGPLPHLGSTTNAAQPEPTRKTPTVSWDDKTRAPTPTPRPAFPAPGPTERDLPAPAPEAVPEPVVDAGR